MKINKIYQFFSEYFRKKRMSQFENIFNIKNETNILDVGGSKFNWQFLVNNPKVTILNLNLPENFKKDAQFNFIEGDATNIDLPDNSFDIVYSNSVIEHLYTKENQIKMANEILRLGKEMYLQTPSKYFFVEPHLITPFIHWLPKKIQKLLIRNFTIWGLITRPSKEYANNLLNELRLLTYKELKQMFPGCKIIKEKFLFMSKSYIVIKK